MRARTGGNSAATAADDDYDDDYDDDDNDDETGELEDRLSRKYILTEMARCSGEGKTDRECNGLCTLYTAWRLDKLGQEKRGRDVDEKMIRQIAYALQDTEATL